MSASGLLLKILEELIETSFDRAFDDQLWNSGNFTFAIHMSAVGEQRARAVIGEVNNAASTDGAQGAAWFCNQLNARIRNNLTGLQVNGVRATNTRNAGCDGQFELATGWKIDKLSKIAARDAEIGRASC